MEKQTTKSTKRHEDLKALRVLRAAFVFFVIILSPALSTAQTTTGSIEGAIIDENGAPLPGVLVRLVSLDNGFARARRTDANGIYRIDLVPAGRYDITAQLDGYTSSSIQNYLVQVNRTETLKPPPIQLFPIAAAPVALTLSTAPAAGSLQVNISDPALRGSAETDFVNALPLAGIRNFDTFALLVPGVAPAPATTGTNGPGIGSGVGTAGQFSVNGQRARANNFTIDGSDNNDQDVGVRRQGFTPAIPQSVESIREFQITTLLADAEAGRNTGGQINVVSEIGENIVHGQVYDFITDSALNARDFFDLTGKSSGDENPFTRNQFGGAIGFPIKKDCLHFFGAFERQDINRAQETHFAVPTITERNASLAFGLKNTGKINPLGRDAFALFPSPNNPGGPYGANTFTDILPASGEGTLFALKLDYQLSLFGKASNFTSRYNFTDDETRIPSVGSAINASITANTRTQNIAFTLNTDLSEKSSNQIRFSYGRTALGFDEVPGSPFIFQSGTSVGDLTGDGKPDGVTGPIGRLLLAPFSPIGVDPFTFPQGRANNTFQIADTFILTRGKNTLKFGADIRRVQFNSFLDRNYRAQLSFAPSFLTKISGGLFLQSGLDFAGLGAPSDILQTLAVTPDSTLGLRFTETNLFISDIFRIHPRVTLNFGLRYERNGVPTDAAGRLERAITLRDSDLIFDPSDEFAQIFLDSLNAQRRFLAGRKKIYEADNNNFAPRVGIAWDINGNGRTSLRAGYGLFYDPILGNIVSQSRNVFPNFVPVNFGFGQLDQLFSEIISNPAIIRFGLDLDIPLVQSGTVNTIGLPPAHIVSGLGQLLSLEGFALSFTLPEKNLRTPYAHQYSAAFERALFNRYIASVAYVGTTGRKLIRARTPNGGLFNPLLVTITGIAKPTVTPLLSQDGRPEPDLGAITIFESSAESDYHALQANLIRRAADGFGFQMAYTYSHAIDEASDVFDLAGGFALAQDEMERGPGLKAERGSAAFDVRHRFTAGFQYELPFASKNKLLGGFQLSGILTLQTGQPFTINTSVDANADGNLTDRLNTTTGLIISDDGRTRIRLAPNTSPISLLAIDDPLRVKLNGAVGRNSFRAAGIASLDIAIDKRFKISEGQSLRLRVEIFNLFNRSHFAIPVRILEAPGFGSSATTSLPARTVQFALRYSF